MEYEVCYGLTDQGDGGVMWRIHDGADYLPLGFRGKDHAIKYVIRELGGTPSVADKVVMYLDGVRSDHENVAMEAVKNRVSLRAYKAELIERFRGRDVVFKTE